MPGVRREGRRTRFGRRREDVKLLGVVDPDEFEGASEGSGRIQGHPAGRDQGAELTALRMPSGGVEM